MHVAVLSVHSVYFVDLWFLRVDLILLVVVVFSSSSVPNNVLRRV